MSLKDILAAQKAGQETEQEAAPTVCSCSSPMECMGFSTLGCKDKADNWALASDEKEEILEEVEALPATPEVSVPSISSSAMLVDLHVSQWAARKKDKTASATVTDSNGAQTGSADVRKSLLHGCPELEAIKKFVATNRNAHYAMTMPWIDRGPRLLPTARMFDFQKNITEIQNEFERLCEAFFNAYEWEAVQAEARLGTLFEK